MSTQALGDVQLLTKQEVEAMLDRVVTPRDEISEMIAEETKARDISEANIKAAIAEERTARANDKLELEDKVSDEATLRSESDAGLRTDIEQEAEKRKQADSDIVQAIEDFRTFEDETYPNAYVEKIKGLPIALLTVHNTDKSLSVGDTIATLDEKFFPRQAVDFIMYVEQIRSGASQTVMITCRLDNNGNINVVNMFDVTGATSATDRVTVLYFTEA